MSNVRDELLAIQAASNDGMLHCEVAVEWARSNPSSALYGALEWDDTKAAAEYRLWQVRYLVRIHIVNHDDGPTLMSLSIDRKERGGYRHVSEIAQRPDLLEIMLQDALGELNRVRRKYARVKQLAKVWAAVDSLSPK